jgi:hypothetical protein
MEYFTVAEVTGKAAYFHTGVLLRLLFNSEDGGDMFLRKPNDY